MTVRRLPLLSVSASLLDRDDIREGFEFLMTWNNVVLEKRRAEGFASLLTAGDALAQKTFAASGYKLVLFPPLVNSIILGGGYRCASNHVRPSPLGEAGPKGRVRGHARLEFHPRTPLIRRFAAPSPEGEGSRYLIDFKYSFASLASLLSGASWMTFSRSGLACLALPA